MGEAPAILNLHKLEDKEPYVNVMVYGSSGVGKTVFASTAPRPILWLEAEGGTHSIGDTKDIDVVTVTGLETYREALKFLQANPGQYKTVVLDSITEAAAGLMKEIMGFAVAKDSDRDQYEPQFNEWRKLTSLIRDIVRSYRDLPVHFVITALEREDTDEMSGRVKVRPALSPKVADEMPQFLDAVGYMYAKGNVVDSKDDAADRDPIQRMLLIRPTAKHTAKLRAPEGVEVPDSILDPTFDDIARLVLAKT